MESTRLSALDASFLRIESPTCHMHVGWRGIFEVSPSRERPTVAALRASIGGRLRYAGCFRQRLAFPPAGLGEPFWVDDQSFDLNFHVRRLGDPYARMAMSDFLAAADDVLSKSLDRRRPLWEVHLAPRLEDGRVGLVMKMHHAMVDGMSAVKLALLVFHASPDAEPEPADDWSPSAAPKGATMALRAVTDSAAESLRAARGLAGLAGSPLAGSGRIASGLRKTALAVGDDLLRSSPSSYVNRAIGPKRTLVGCRIPLDGVQSIKARTGVTHNDVCLTVVAGALRETGQRRGDRLAAMRAMVPVSMRAKEPDTGLGNRISFAFVDLPVDRAGARQRLRSIHTQTQRFKSNERAATTETLLGAMRFTAAPVRTFAARMVASPRVYNLTVSNVPGPREAVYMLGARLIEAYPVVPLSQGHTLAVGMFTYAGGVHFGLYADPEALPEVADLPGALIRAITQLDRSTRVRPPGNAVDRRSAGARVVVRLGASPVSETWPRSHDRGRLGSRPERTRRGMSAPPPTP